VSAAANEQIRPPIYPRTQTTEVQEKPVMMIHISEGVSKPYCDKDAAYWVKSGSDKRKASPQELARMFQESGQIQIDEIATAAGIDEIDLPKFRTFFEKNYSREVNAEGLPVERILQNMNLAKNAVIRLLVFKNRVEIVSPGKLPNHLSIENIKSGNSVMRNPLLASFGTKILPYSGIGSGVPRILKNHPATELLNDQDGEQFTIVLRRTKKV
jgi:predicted HTH transcriptional regulator